MKVGQLSATPRAGRGKGAARKLRAEGLVPGIVYGRKQEPVPLALNPRDLNSLLRTSPWRRNTVIELSLGDEAKLPVLIKEIDVHPVSRAIVHVDLLNIDLNEKVRADVPLKLVGRPEGVKAGGLLQQTARSLKVECLPKDIPAQIEADVSHLERKQAMMIEDVKPPEGTTIVIRESIAVAVIN